MKNKLIMSIVGIAIGVILVGSILAPVIEDATDHTVTYDNRLGAVSYVDKTSDAITITGTTNTLQINGVSSPVLNASYSTLFADTFAFRSSGGAIHVNLFALNSVRDYIGAINLVADHGHLTGTVGETEIDHEYNYIYFATYGEADYVMTNAQGAYVHKSDTIECYAYNSVMGSTTATRWAHIEGSIENGFTAKMVSGQEYEATTVNYTPVDGVDDLYLLTSITFTINDGSIIIDRFAAPANTDAIADHDSQVDNLLKTLPLFVIVALLLSATAIIRARN